MKISYDRDEDILTVELHPSAKIDHAQQIETMILHISQDDEPVLLEILGASEFLSAVLKASMRAQPMAI
ncbi:MAG: DUF2283 domain-containing protein [Chloroflexota bacterium]